MSNSNTNNLCGTDTSTNTSVNNQSDFYTDRQTDFISDKQTEFPTDNINFSSISSILNLILGAFTIPKKPLTPLPPPLLLFGGQNRSGIIASEIASRIISRQSEAGLVVGDVYADGKNSAEAMELIRVQEITDALLNDAKVEIVVPPGVPVTVIGANAGGPVVCQGATTSFGSGWGLLR